MKGRNMAGKFVCAWGNSKNSEEAQDQELRFEEWVACEEKKKRKECEGLKGQEKKERVDEKERGGDRPARPYQGVSGFPRFDRPIRGRLSRKHRTAWKANKGRTDVDKGTLGKSQPKTRLEPHRKAQHWLYH